MTLPVRGTLFNQVISENTAFEFNTKFAHTKGVFHIQSTAVSGTAPTLDVDIQWQDPANNAWITLRSFSQVINDTADETIYIGHPSDTIFLPSGKLRANVTIGGTGSPSVTASLGYELA